MRQATLITSRHAIAAAWSKVKAAALAGVDEDDWSSKHKYSASSGETNPRVFQLNFWHDRHEEGQKTLELVFERATPTLFRRSAAFVRVSGEGICLAHSGRIGGHGPRAGKGKFFPWFTKRYGASRFTAVGGRATPYPHILIGLVGASDLQRQIAAYVRDVQKFRGGEAPRPPATGRRYRARDWEPRALNNRRIRVNLPESVIVTRVHEAVVSSLGGRLRRAGMKELRHDKERDLVFVKKDGTPEILFEIKTNARTTSLYTGTGQLMLHGAGNPPPPTRVLVVPEMLDRDTTARLRRLGVGVLVYGWKGDVPRFRNWREVVG